MDIHLRDLRSRSWARVLQIERPLYLSCCRCPGLRQLQVAVLELRIAEAVTKGIEWNALEVEIGKSLRNIVLVLRRHTVQTGVDRIRKMAARGVVAQQNLCNRRAAGLSWIPRVQNCREMFVCPRDRQWPGIHQHQDRL